VLLIEDNPVDARMVQGLIGAENGAFVCESVNTIAAGLDRLHHGGIDVVLLGLGLGLGGLDNVLRIQASAPDVAIIPLTIGSEDAIGLKAVQLGAQDYLTKASLAQHPLIHAIRNAVERKRAHDAHRTEPELHDGYRSSELNELYEGELRAHGQAENLRAASLALTQSLDLDQVLLSLLDCLAILVPYDSACVILHVAESQFGVAVARGYEYFADGVPLKRMVFDMQAYPHLREILESRRSMIIPDTATHPGWNASLGAGLLIRNSVGVPLIAHDNVIGLYSVDKRDPNFFTAEHQQLCEALAPQAAIAIENARMYAALGSREEQLRALSHRLVQMQEAERREIARELHDEVGQVLTGLNLVLGTAARQAAEKVGEGLAQAQTLLNDLMGRVRALSLDLRPLMLDDLGLLHALVWLFDRYTGQTGVSVRFTQTGIRGRRFGQDIETAAFRIVQEALTNVARYSGVDEALVHIWASDDMISVQIEDRGRGFDVDAVLFAGQSSGLAGMRERTELIGGRLTIDSVPGTGTYVSANLPLKAAGRVERGGV